MWLTGKLAPDFKTIADVRRDHGAAIPAACRRFVLVCRKLGLIAATAQNLRKLAKLIPMPAQPLPA